MATSRSGPALPLFVSVSPPTLVGVTLVETVLSYILREVPSERTYC